MDVQGRRVGRGNRGRKRDAGAVQGSGPPTQATGNGKALDDSKQPVHQPIREEPTEYVEYKVPDYIDIIP